MQIPEATGARHREGGRVQPLTDITTPLLRELVDIGLMAFRSTRQPNAAIATGNPGHERRTAESAVRVDRDGVSANEGPRRPWAAWYSLSGGPKNFAELAEATGMARCIGCSTTGPASDTRTISGHSCR
jgi:hypothetical protein